MTASGTYRPVWAEVDLAAVRHNAARLAALAAPAALCAVVKADGYGHGAEAVAREALAGGASVLAVALVEEGQRLRRAGIEAPVLLLSEAPLDGMDEVVASRLTPTIYSHDGLSALVAATVRHEGPPVPVHLKVDTGMHRVGVAPSEAVALAERITGQSSLTLEGAFTHLAVADEVDDPHTSEQLVRYEAVLGRLAAAGIRPKVRHAANSAGALWHPSARYDLVRCGISLYGLAPGDPAADDESASRWQAAGLRPVLSLKARVSYVKRLDAGERLSYGLRYRLARPATIATVPIGYADGLTRRLSAVGGEVLIGGHRRPLAGTVTMDQTLVDCGDDCVCVGDEVVLIGDQGGDRLGAWDWARRTGTIAYEVVCGLGRRVPRIGMHE